MSAAAVAPAQSPSNSSAAASVVLTKTEDVSSEKKVSTANTKSNNNNCTSSIHSESKETAANKATTTESESPLPADLQLILNEVARTGKCPWLSWNGKDPPEAPMPPDMMHTNTASSVASSSKASSVGSRSVLAKHRGTSAFSSISRSSSGPSRKKLRNGVRQRSRYTSSAANENGSSSSSAAAPTTAGRKRPLYLTRTPSATGSTFSASSIGSGGSEVEDSTQYECDSEGTSATTNSELSRDEKRAARKRVIIQTSPGSIPIMNVGGSANNNMTTFKTLRGALRTALTLVLDHSYRTRGGYKLSPAELRIHAAAVAAQTAASNAVAAAEGGNGGSEKENSPELADLEPPSPEKTFSQRKRRLLALLGEDSSDATEAPPHSPSHLGHHGPSYLGGGNLEFQEGPPFTIQRIAEVLVAPERYYKQTHKLCNCLEKLLLVTSPASSFGESNGVDMSQGKGGNNELMVTSDKKGRQDVEMRNSKRLRRRMSSSSDASSDDESGHKTGPQHEKPTDEIMSTSSPDSKVDSPGYKSDMQDQVTPANGSEMSSKEILEAAARAQLRSKFDHVGIDPHSSSAVDRSVPGIPNRGMTSSPPPPGLANAAALSPHGGVSGFALHVGEHSPGSGDSTSDSVPHPSTIQQNPMPFFSAANETSTPISAVHASTNQNLSMLQMHHEAALSSSAGLAASAASNPPLELVVGPSEGAASSSADVADLDVEPSGRSSASNSDVDSESDDFYLDDSASDRSDGSDSGHSEPFTAARVMALNRIQQQRARRESANQTLHYQHGLGFRPPLDTEYQSGDSIDSTMAEDSCGSDSSSASDLAD